MSRLTVTMRGAKEARKLLDSLSGRELQNRARRATRRGAAVMRKELRSRAASSQFPRSFRKTKTINHRTPLGTSTGPTSPLLNIFEPGAGTHEIGAPGQVLSNPDAGFFARGPVTHPGMAARPLIGPVFEATKDEATERAMDELLRGVK